MNKKAVCSVVGAGCLWGIISIFIRRLSAAGMNSLHIGFIRTLVAMILFVAVALIRDRKSLKIRPKDLWIFAGTGIVSIAIFNLLYFYTMIQSQTSVAVVLLYTSPVFVMLLSALIFKEKITGRKVAALTLTILGCVLVAGLGEGKLSVAPLILLTGIGSGLFYALYTIFARFALDRYSSLTTTVWTFVMATLGTIPTGDPAGTLGIIGKDPGILLWVLGLAVCSTAMPYFLYTLGLQHMESGKAAILVAVEPLVGTLVGVLLWGEPMSLFKGLGVLLILGSVVLLNLKAEPQRETELNR